MSHLVPENSGKNWRKSGFPSGYDIMSPVGWVRCPLSESHGLCYHLQSSAWSVFSWNCWTKKRNKNFRIPEKSSFQMVERCLIRMVKFSNGIWKPDRKSNSLKVKFTNVSGNWTLVIWIPTIYFWSKRLICYICAIVKNVRNRNFFREFIVTNSKIRNFACECECEKFASIRKIC